MSVSDDKHLLFINSNGRRIYNPSTDLSNILKRYGVEEMNCTDARHIITTIACQYCTEEEQDIINRMLTHTPATAKKNYAETSTMAVPHRRGIPLLESLQKTGEVLSKFKCRGFRATSLSTYDFSTLYTTLPHNLIKEKLLDLIEWTFKRALKTMVHFIWHVMTERLFSLPLTKVGTLWSCQNVCDALSYLLDNIYIRFGTKLYRQIVGNPMGTNCAPLVADLFLYCYERDFMDSLNHNNQADVIEAFNSDSRYLDDLLNIDNPYFGGMVNQIYPPELQLNKANISDTEAPFLDLHLSVANEFVSSKIYDKRDDFDFDIVNFPFLDGDIPRRASYFVCLFVCCLATHQP